MTREEFASLCRDEIARLEAIGVRPEIIACDCNTMNCQGWRIHIELRAADARREQP